MVSVLDKSLCLSDRLTNTLLYKSAIAIGSIDIPVWWHYCPGCPFFRDNDSRQQHEFCKGSPIIAEVFSSSVQPWIQTCCRADLQLRYSKKVVERLHPLDQDQGTGWGYADLPGLPSWPLPMVMAKNTSWWYEWLGEIEACWGIQTLDHNWYDKCSW